VVIYFLTLTLIICYFLGFPIYRILIVLILASASPAVNALKNPFPWQVEKTKYLKLRINKYDEERMKVLLNELTSYEDKIAEVSFDKTTGELLVYYLSPFNVDDILQLVSVYCPDFDKIGGTEL
jgi:hypothetical protein